MAGIKDATLDAMAMTEDRWNAQTQEMVKLAMAFVLYSQGIHEGTVRYNADMIRTMLTTHKVTADFHMADDQFSVTLSPREPMDQEALPL